MWSGSTLLATIYDSISSIMRHWLEVRLFLCCLLLNCDKMCHWCLLNLFLVNFLIIFHSAKIYFLFLLSFFPFYICAHTFFVTQCIWIKHLSSLNSQSSHLTCLPFILTGHYPPSMFNTCNHLAVDPYSAFLRWCPPQGLSDIFLPLTQSFMSFFLNHLRWPHSFYTWYFWNTWHHFKCIFFALKNKNCLSEHLSLDTIWAMTHKIIRLTPAWFLFMGSY